jgi:hypothetical protein
MACELGAASMGAFALAVVLQGESTSADHATTPVACPAHVSELPASPLFSPDDPRLAGAKLLVVDKGHRRIMAFEQRGLSECFRIGLGFAPTGHKQVEGDGRTPEGWYRTSDKPWSSFNKAIAVHYPNAVDARHAHRHGRIPKRVRDEVLAAHRRGRAPPQRTTMGGEILIHGGGSAVDWTLGCIALDDADLDTLRAWLPPKMRTDLLVLP